METYFKESFLITLTPFWLYCPPSNS